jgi:hypothetical protein
MLDRNRVYTERWTDDWAEYKLEFWYEPELESWISQESHCGFGPADFWTSDQEYMCNEKEVERFVMH